MELGIMFFSSAHDAVPDDRYGLLLDAARFADRNGFCCIWTPERHFHSFGGLFPNPSVMSAALATITERLQLRAGSLISPLHQPVRIVEEWSVVDNLSRGRVAVSFGCGWNADDFVFFPEHFSERQKVMYQQIEEIRRLWRGEPVRRKNGSGKEIEFQLYPRPLQRDLPVWITSSGNAETFASAGAAGANILTHLIGQDLPALAQKIERYREARAGTGLPANAGKVTLMLHTFLGEDREAVRDVVRQPFREYLRTALSLEQLAAAGGGVVSGGHRIEVHEIPADALEDLLDVTFERYFEGASLMGTPEDGARFIARLEEIGVDEVACLIDFLPDRRAVLASLEKLAGLRLLVDRPAVAAAFEQFTGNLEI